MKEYELRIKQNSTCPAAPIVRELLEKGAASVNVVIGADKVRGAYPVYLEDESRQNLFGFVNLITDNETTIGDDEIQKLISAKPTIKLNRMMSANIIHASIQVDDTQRSAVDNTFVSERLQKIMDEKIAAGFVTAEDMDAKLKYMQANHVPEPVMYRVVKGYRKYNKPAQRQKTAYIDHALTENKEGVITEGLRCALLRQPTICEGEKSVGKNIYMENIAWLLNMPLYMIGFSRNMDPNSIYGEKSTDNSASEALRGMEDGAIAKVMLETNQPFKSAESQRKAVNAAAAFELNKAMAASVSIITDASELYDWMVDGGVMVFNEMNMAESNFFSSFANPLTDGTGFLFFPGRGEIKKNDDAVLFGTQNADYEGVQTQNEATISRFNTLHFPQPRNIAELLKVATESNLKAIDCDYKLPDKYYKVAEQFYQGCMDAVHKGTIRNDVLNIRGLVRALTVVADSECTCTLARWLDVGVVSTCPATDQQHIRSILKSMVVI